MQEQMQPPKRRRSDVYDDSQNAETLTPTTTNERSAGVSAQAGQTLGGIDAVLREAEAHPVKSASANSDRGAVKAGEGLAAAAGGASGGGEGGPAKSLFNPEGEKASGGAAWAGAAIIAALGNKPSRNKALAGIGAGGGITGILIGGFMGLLPFRINTLVETAAKKWIGDSSEKLDEESGSLLEDYMRTYVMPGLNPRCPSTRVNRSCALPVKGSSPVAALYQGWRQKNIEHKFYTKYDIAFERDNAGRLIMERGGRRTVVNNSEARQAIRDALERETLFRRATLRFSLRPIMAKYSIRRCVAACDVNDRFRESTRIKKQAGKAWLTERFLSPYAGKLGMVLECVIDAGCNPGNESGSRDENTGERRTEFSEKMQARMAAYAAKYGTESLEAAVKRADGILADGYGRYVVKQLTGYMVGKFGGDQAAQEASKNIAAKGVPVIGWIDLAAQVVGTVKNAPGKIKVMRYTIITATMAEVYTTYRTVADETRSGHMDTTELGSMASTLNSGSRPDGSGTNAEGTPLYNADFPSLTVKPQAALFENFFSDKAYAAAAKPNLTSYKCDNGESPHVSQDKPACSEENAVSDNASLQLMADSIPEPLPTIATAWNSTVGTVFGWIFGPIGGLISKIPGVSDLASLASKAADSLMNNFASFFQLPSFINPDGGRIGAFLIGGANVIGNEYSHNVIGGRKVTPTEAAAIDNAQIEKERKAFESKSFYARMFDKDDTNSFVSHVALALPPDIGLSIRNNFMSIISNPFASITHSFSAVLTPRTAFAAVPVTADPQGITQYRYDGAVPAHPEADWDKNNCQDDKATKEWRNNAVYNPDTGQFDNNSNNPCLIIKAATEANSAYYLADQPAEGGQ
jgi:hypothetical protein